MVDWLAGFGNAEVTRICTFAFPGLPAENHHKLNCPVDLRICHILVITYGNEGIQCKPVQPCSDVNKLNTTTTPPPAPPFSAIICHHPASLEVTGCRHRTDATRPVMDPSRDGRKFPCLSGWWFQTFFIFTLLGGNDPIWLIFFKWVVQPPTSYASLPNCLEVMIRGIGPLVSAPYESVFFCRITGTCAIGRTFSTDVFSKTITGKTTSSWPCLPEMIPTWSLTARPWKVTGIQKERIVFQPSFSMGELLNFRDVPNF